MQGANKYIDEGGIYIYVLVIYAVGTHSVGQEKIETAYSLGDLESMDVPSFLSGIIGFVPAIIILYISLARYDGLFDDRKVFVMLVVGFAVGVFVALFHIFFSETNIIVYVMLFPIFEELAKFVVLNLPRFHAKYDTTFYGVSLGVGIGAATMIAITVLLVKIPGTSIVLRDALTLVLLAFITCTLHGSLGAFIGFGVYQGEAWRMLGIAIFLHAIYNCFMQLFVWNSWYLILIIAYTALIYYYIYVYLLPESLPENLRRARRRELRKSFLRKRAKN